MIPSEQEGESFTEAVARVCRCIGGGMAAANDDDSDSDLEVIADNVTINLRCPVSLLNSECVVTNSEKLNVW